MSATSLPDGAEALMAVLKLGDVMRLIEHTARWVDPEHLIFCLFGTLSTHGARFSTGVIGQSHR